jgi:hypothetical protein
MTEAELPAELIAEIRRFSEMMAERAQTLPANTWEPLHAQWCKVAWLLDRWAGGSVR